MRSRRLAAAVAALLLLVLSIPLGNTAANGVPTTKAGDDSRSITPNDLKPIECAAISLTATLSGSGNIDGANTDELITGSATGDTFKGGQGDDCILGGDGNDSLNGGPGTDVCIGGAGTDSFHPSCETAIQ